MHISATKFEEHYSNISGDILDSTTYDVITFLICIIQKLKFLQHEKKEIPKRKMPFLFNLTILGLHVT